MVCAYCFDNNKEKSLLTCRKCQKCIHVSCLKTGCIPGGLIGDPFFDFLCYECSGSGKEQLKRHKIPWIAVVALALYNLHHKSAGMSLKGYFHYKLHIVNFIDKNWGVLFEPTFRRKKSWTGTVSGTLSHFCPTYFLSGNEFLKDSGWWRLTDPNMTPQEVLEKHTKVQAAKKKVGKQSVKSPEGNSLLRSGANSPVPGTSDELNISASEDMRSVDLTTLGSAAPVAPSSNMLEDVHPLKVWADRELQSLGSIEKLPSPDLLLRFIDADNPASDSFSVSNMGDSEVFSDYLFSEDENLADMDIDMEDIDSLVLGASGSAPFQDLDYLLHPEAVNMAESESTNHSFSSGPIEDPVFISRGCNLLSEDRASVKLGTSGSVLADSEPEDDLPVCEKVLSKSLFEVTPPEKRIPPWELKKDEQKKPSEAASCIPMSEYEELQLLSQLRRAANVKELTGHARRLYRKLYVRRLKRERGMPLFNLDNMFRPGKMLGQSASVWSKPPRNVAGCQDSDVRILDRFHHVRATVGASQKQTCSFRFRLMGCAEPTCFVSPFTQRQLKPYIWRDYETVPLWLKFLEEIQKRANRNNPEWKPAARSPIDYCYVRPQHISTINSLCTEFFYPGIDLSEALQYPDFSCVVLYKKLIVGFAFMVPDAGFNETYISFLFTRPEWRGAGIATFMVYHLIQTCMGKDVTLHVSATNPALILYQKFGFKVEEFVQDFYDKYFPPDSKECKHAFFLRLSR